MLRVIESYMLVIMISDKEVRKPRRYKLTCLIFNNREGEIADID
jgi:hypothetical protein